MNAFTDWLTMNGYGIWVWSAYGLWALGFAWLTVSTIVQRRRALKRLGQAARRERLKLNKESS